MGIIGGGYVGRKEKCELLFRRMSNGIQVIPLLGHLGSL